MNNNFRGLVFHILVIVFMFFLSLLLNISEVVRNFVYTSFIFKIILTILPAFIYYNLAKIMSKKSSKKFDFLNGIFIVIIGLILGIIAFTGLGLGIFSKEVFSSMWRFPLDIFLFPQMYILEIYNIRHNIITFIIILFIPSIIYGFSIRSSRRKIAKRKRINRMKERRMNRTK
ncbi:hypothetical protein [Peptoniphilus stercorisuis]|uniref:TRAP-type uncharacterized transport system fused permease subunit n=1 Tax=Peptoniphilus stercorisuis TaxID=1436965 RepID=A0ABS4KH98_9FIRM|nr:hypothetical protein [Peptoniphilus stercorisuis]MBP2025984.1 TRAP-type uncharacterized transport system fused permease subunit [Peptoniphilus stercorisuis]